MMIKNIRLGISLVYLWLFITTAHAAVTTGQTAPTFTLPSLTTNQSISLNQYRGKIVLVDFWASWCIPCRASFPAYDRLQKKFQSKGFVVLAISVDKNIDAAKRFINKYPTSFQKLHDPNGRVASQYGPPTMPSAYLIDKQGRVVKVIPGFVSSHEQELSTLIQRL